MLLTKFSGLPTSKNTSPCSKVNPNLKNCQSREILSIMFGSCSVKPLENNFQPFDLVAPIHYQYCLLKPENFKIVSKISLHVTFLSTPSQKCQIGIKIVLLLGTVCQSHASKVFSDLKSAPSGTKSSESTAHTTRLLAKSSVHSGDDRLLDYFSSKRNFPDPFSESPLCAYIFEPIIFLSFWLATFYIRF